MRVAYSNFTSEGNLSPALMGAIVIELVGCCGGGGGVVCCVVVREKLELEDRKERSQGGMQWNRVECFR